MNNLLILRGSSGSGKSTFTEMLRKIEPDLVHCSADFIHLDSSGVYRFNPSKLGEGHGQCFRMAIESMQAQKGLVVVDNTNTSLVELAPYVAAGQAFGYRTALVRLTVPTSVAAARNVHGVPTDTVKSMVDRMQKPLNRWPSETVFEDPTENEVLNFYANLTR